MKFVLSCLVLATAVASAGAQQRVYRCETDGKVAYSDAPCVGAKVIDATPTQGMDKMTGQSRKGKDVQTIEIQRRGGIDVGSVPKADTWVLSPSLIHLWSSHQVWRPPGPHQ